MRTMNFAVLFLVLGGGGQVIVHAQHKTTPPRLTVRADEPCDIYASAGTPCVAAHSTTRALYSSYRGALYQVKRVADGQTLDINVVVPHLARRARYADAASQDRFCSNALCVINIIYDQSGKGNHLYQAVPGTFKGPAKGGFDTQPIADMAPVTVDGHKVYGVYILPGMGLRNNDASYLPTGDEPQGIYYVVDGTHYDSGCCFDYGNASTNGRAVGTGTMDTTYFGTSTVWGKGAGAGPWLMTDMEAGLFSGHSAKENSADPTIDRWRFVTAVVDGGGGNSWDLRGGDAQIGKLTTFYNGARPDPNPSGGYFPMRRQGGVLLGTGGDNGNGSAGTFYEGVITAGRPSEATTDAVHANIIAARYNIAPVSMTRLSAFTPGSSQDVTVTFTNGEQTPASDVQLRLALPSKEWMAHSTPNGTSSVQIAKNLAPGASATITFKVTSPNRTGSGFLTAIAEWSGARSSRTRETAVQRIRSVPAVKLNEVRFGTISNPTDQFIELYNASENRVDISNWRLIHTPSQWAPIPIALVPSGITLGAHAFYLLGVSTSSLVAPAIAGATLLNVRSIGALAAGQTINVDGETRTIASVGTAAEAMTTVFIPVSTGPRMTFSSGAGNLPVTNATGFVVGEKIGIDAGGHYEVSTVTAVGKAATQSTLSEAAPAGANTIEVESGANITPDDTLIIGTGQRKEPVKASKVNAIGKRTEVVLQAPLKFDHMSGIDVSDRGTGISFSPATKFAHMSGDAVQALGSGISLVSSLQYAHGYGAPIQASKVTVSGYQGQAAPDQWFGNPLSPSAGSIALMDASGTSVIDALVYGSQQSNSSANGTIASPELATLEGVQDGGGCIVVVPSSLRTPGASVGRYPDGIDSGNNCKDFKRQAAASILMNLSVGDTNIKVSNVNGFSAGQSVVIGSGYSQESVTISVVGTAGGALVSTDAPAGATVVPVSTTEGFLPGSTISIGSGAEAESATIVSASRRAPVRLTLSAPLAREHAAGSTVAGTGITLLSGLKGPHNSGAVLASALPTPGKSNQ